MRKMITMAAVIRSTMRGRMTAIKVLKGTVL